MMNNSTNAVKTTSYPQQQNQFPAHNTLTFSEAWEFIFERKVSKDKLYSEVRSGRVPHIRIGTKILFRRDTLEDWFREQEDTAYSAKYNP